MARNKRSAAAAAAAPQNPNPNSAVPAKPGADLGTAAAAAADKKLSTLKSLNDILLKKTAELREKETVAADAAFVAEFQNEIALLVLSSKLADENVRLSCESGVVVKESMETLKNAVADRDRMWEELDGKVSEVSVMRSLREADLERMAAMVEEARVVAAARDGLEVELKRVQVKFDSLKKEKDQEVSSLRNAFDLKKDEMETERGKVLDELRSVRVDFHGLKKEKEQLEKSCKDLERKMGELAAEKDGIVREREEQDVVISSKVEEIRELSLTIARLEADYRNLGNEFGSVKEEMEQKNGKVLDELRSVRVDFHALKNEKEQSERSFEAQMDKVRLETMDLEEQKDEIERERDELLRRFELARDQWERELINFKETSSSTKGELEQKHKEKEDQLKVLQMKFDALLNEKDKSEEKFNSRTEQLVGQLDEIKRANAGQDAVISSQVVELRSLEFARDQMETELKDCKNTFHSIKEELERGRAKDLYELKNIQVDFDVLKKEKEQSEMSLKLAVKETAKKLDALTTELGELAALKDAIEREKAKQGVVITGLEKDIKQLQAKVSEAHKELNVEREKAEGLKLLVAELENCKTHIEQELGRAKSEHELDIARQLNLMEVENAEARKKNGRFFAWFVPAATTATAILAAGLTSYTSKQRTLSYNR